MTNYLKSMHLILLEWIGSTAVPLIDRETFV